MCGDKPEDKSIRMLGFFLDEWLKLNYHSEILSKKLSKATFALNRNKHFLPTKIMKMLYYSLFDCHLNYCSIILSAASYAVLIRPILLQKRAVRIVKCADFPAHTADIFKELNINVICFMNNYRKNRLPPIFSNYFLLKHSVSHFTIFSEMLTTTMFSGLDMSILNISIHCIGIISAAITRGAFFTKI